MKLNHISGAQQTAVMQNYVAAMTARHTAYSAGIGMNLESTGPTKAKPSAYSR